VKRKGAKEGPQRLTGLTHAPYISKEMAFVGGDAVNKGGMGYRQNGKRYVVATFLPLTTNLAGLNSPRQREQLATKKACPRGYSSAPWDNAEIAAAFTPPSTPI
jgi:hypothetical protein